MDADTRRTMSDLHDALRGDMVKTAMPDERITEGVESVIIPTQHWAAMREAARLVANPPPRTELIEDFVTELLQGDLINQNSSNIEGEVRQVVLNLTGRWDAALTGATE